MFGEISASHRVKPGLMSGQSVMNGSYNITAATGTYVDTGLSLSLPSAGTYLIGYNVRAHISLKSINFNG